MGEEEIKALVRAEVQTILAEMEAKKADEAEYAFENGFGRHVDDPMVLYRPARIVVRTEKSNG